MAKVKGGHYQIACQNHFDITHPDHQKLQLLGGDAVANHPNAWLQASISYNKLKNGDKILAGAGTQIPVEVATGETSDKVDTNDASVN